jgi:alkylated DNA repair dioxygenase AlkB
MGSPSQSDLFARPLPAGLSYRTEFLSHDEEAGLMERIRSLPLAHSQYRQFTAKRRTVNYGFAYDFTHLEAKAAPPIPEFLAPLRARAADWAAVPAEDFVQGLISEYQPGTQLGWHRDVPDFELIVGVSLAGECRIRFRPYPWKPERKRDVFALELVPRSAYILRDEARWGWQHSIPPTKVLRYSITFRTARKGTARPRQR